MPAYAEYTDEQLANTCLNQPELFGLLVERYQTKLTRYMLRISNVSKEDCEDMLQEVFIRVYKHLNDFDPSLSFSSWIYRIAHNHVRSQYRRQQARPKQIEIDDVMMNKLKSDDDIAAALDAQIEKAVLAKALATLDEKYRTVLVLKFLEEKSYEEISDILQKPTGTIGTLINRAKKKLKKALVTSYE